MFIILNIRVGIVARSVNSYNKLVLNLVHRAKKAGIVHVDVKINMKYVYKYIFCNLLLREVSFCLTLFYGNYFWCVLN